MSIQRRGYNTRQEGKRDDDHTVSGGGWSSSDTNDDGSQTTLQIMRIDSDEVENYACAMPRYYAIPLILINKQLAFYEAQVTI